MNGNDLLTVDPDLLGGTPGFKRVPGRTWFDYLEDNSTIEEFLECFPAVTRGMVCRVLDRPEAARWQPVTARGCSLMKHPVRP